MSKLTVKARALVTVGEGEIVDADYWPPVKGDN
jgi:hypothetical protein